MRESTDDILILGGGLTGLSAGCILTRSGLRVKVYERDSTVGGLSKTIFHNGYRFDLGGHRFFTKDERLNDFVKDLMGDELISVPRKSKIYMRNKYFDYPLKPLNAMFGLGIPTTLKIIMDYGLEKAKNLVRRPSHVSLEDWVVSNFGRKMFNIYFKEYSEKVWGIECGKISAGWVAQRIRGLSLGKAIKNAFFKMNGKDIPTLVDRFVYPGLGIGRISDRLKEETEKANEVFTDMSVESVNHCNFNIESIKVKNLIPFLAKREKGDVGIVHGKEFISSIPVTRLIKMLNPPPPQGILDIASKLRYRDIVIVTIMVNRNRVTDQTWIYIPEQRIPFGRIHEPTNWSREMAPEGKSLIVMEYFSFKGDKVWNEKDERLVDSAVESLEDLGFIKKHEVADSVVVRVPNAYPLFEVGYKELCNELYDYLAKFKNLHVAGRSGMFRYYNMDHAIESGINTAERLIKKLYSDKDEDTDLVLTGNK